MKELKWLEFSFETDTIDTEIIIAFLSHLPFNSFQESDHLLKAYINSKDLKDNVLKEVNEIIEEFSLRSTITELPDEDWNEIWENTFQPILIPGVCSIYAPFHKDHAPAPVEIIIFPKMAFGTGHHKTTYGMLKMMSKIDYSGKEVLDFGAGTGILGIYTAKKGAHGVLAIDNEGPAIDNLIEHTKLNNTPQVYPVLGEKECIPSLQTFDVILANITRNVLLDALSELSKSLRTGGNIFMSGFFRDDMDDLTNAGQSHGLELENSEMFETWAVMRFIKR